MRADNDQLYKQQAQKEKASARFGSSFEEPVQAVDYQPTASMPPKISQRLRRVTSA